MEKIVQTAGRNALGEFAPDFVHCNDVLFGENRNNRDIDRDSGERRGNHAEQPDAASGDSACFLLLSGADFPAHGDGQTHGKPRNHDGDRLHDSAAGGYGRDIYVGQAAAKLSDHAQVHRAVHRLLSSHSTRRKTHTETNLLFSQGDMRGGSHPSSSRLSGK